MPDEKYVCRACEARDQTITVLADEVDYLRAQIAILQQKPAAPSVTSFQVPLPPGPPNVQKPPLSLIEGGSEDDELEEMRARLNAGEITDADMERLEAAAQALSGLEIAPEA